jgi:hypothetical protein
MVFAMRHVGRIREESVVENQIPSPFDYAQGAE